MVPTTDRYGRGNTARVVKIIGGVHTYRAREMGRGMNKGKHREDFSRQLKLLCLIFCSDSYTSDIYIRKHYGVHTTKCEL